MDRPFWVNELEHTVRMLPVEKAPGPNGFIGSFYKALFSSRSEKFRDTVTLSFVCDNFCPTID
jgi:hypothetical protein